MGIAAVCAVGVVLACFLPERALRETVAATAREGGSEAGGAFAQPVDDGAVEAQLVAAFSALADRDVQRDHIARIFGVILWGELAAWSPRRLQAELEAYQAQVERSLKFRHV